MSGQTILIVEDNENILRINKEALEMEGYHVLTAQSLKKAKEYIDKASIDLILLDIMLPDGSGVEFCRVIRKQIIVPILFLSCLDEKSNIIDGLKNGGDDYMTKPYSIDELITRCAALLRRVEIERNNKQSRMTYGPIVIDTTKKRAFLNGKDILLKPKELSLLILLLENSEHNFTAEDIYQAIWGQTANNDIRTVRVHISSLRKKLRLDEEKSFSIETLNRKYYCLTFQN